MPRKLARVASQIGAVKAIVVAMLVAGPALGQTVRKSEPPAQKSEAEMKAIKERVAQWLATCLEDWDQSTHMSKKEWRTTCERVASERGKFLLEGVGTDPFIKGRRR
jgi:hypothetical protein